jgi:hypothetical protein
MMMKRGLFVLQASLKMVVGVGGNWSLFRGNIVFVDSL